jgi:hypothetical protein
LRDVAEDLGGLVGDLLFYGSVVSTLAMALLGAIVTGHDDWGKKRRWWVYAAFLVLGAIGAIAQVQQFQETKDAEEVARTANNNLTNALNNLSSKATEEAAAIKDMRAAQNDVKQLQAANQKLASETLQLVIGDPHKPPFVLIDNAKIDADAGNLFKVRLYIANSSKTHPVKDVVADLSAGGMRITSDSQSIPPSARVPLSVPNAVGLDAVYVGMPALSSVGARAKYEVHLSCNAGRYVQHLGVVRTGETTLVQSWHVVKLGELKPILSHTDPEFPSNFQWRKDLILR